MTGLFIRALGLVASGTLHPNYYVETEMVMEERLYDEWERNYQNEQEQIIIEDYFLFMEQIGKINYARGCAGTYTPPVRNAEQGKRVRCGSKSFDCSGLIKGYGVAKGLLSSKELGRYNSQSLMDLADKKDGMIARRGDWTSWNSVEGTHFAIVSREYEGDGILWVYDNVNGPNINLLRERPLKVRTEDTVEAVSSDNSNPLGFHITIEGYDYDSIANRTANWRYVRNNSKDMIATYLCENGGFNPDAKSQTDDSGLCQLNNHRGNYYWLHDPRWKSNDYEIKFAFQRQACLDKWNLVQDHSRIWTCYNKRAPYLAKIKDMEGGTWGIDDL
ncbi:MAG TPA: hypothetical protein PLP73_00650 [Candidatus Absconditabacterales bacterium]|nr:hypothetical protein [Candidatus Absconditabacterales bacterium]